jgi:hypothetical protein
VSTWQYQATHRTIHGEDVYEVREVFPEWGDNGETLLTEDAIAPFGETKAELAECLRMMLSDVEHFDVFELDGRDE